MENKKLGMEPAYPLTDTQELGFSTGLGFTGMSKRLLIASEQAAGICVNAGRNGHSFDRVSEIVKKAYEIADELLKQENS